MAKMTMIQALNLALRQEMDKDDGVIVLGEDVGVDGGVFRATDGLINQFGEERPAIPRALGVEDWSIRTAEPGNGEYRGLQLTLGPEPALFSVARLGGSDSLLIRLGEGWG